MSITIKNTPYPSIAKINPVYNGLPFVVDSNKKTLNNFKYIAEIYVSGTKVSELRHNPDISNSNYGIFEVGRIVESYLSYDLNWNKTIALAPRSATKYYINFGEQFSRVIKIKNFYKNGSYWAIQFNTAHNLISGDVISIYGASTSNGTNINSRYVVTYISSISVRLDLLWSSAYTVSSTDAYGLHGEKVTQFLDWTDAFGVKKIRLKVKPQSYFNVGDTVTITNASNTQYENVEWVIEKVLSYSTLTYLDISCPYTNSTPSTTTGTVVSRDNFVIRKLFSTSSYNAIAFNGVEQYENYLDWDADGYLFTGNTCKYLTKKPERSYNVCSDDYLTLSAFGKNDITTWNLITNPFYQIIETWQNPTSTLSGSILSSSSNNTYSTGRLSVVVSGNYSAISMGDFVNISINGTATQLRVINVSYSVGLNQTTLVIDHSYSVSETYGTLSWVIKVIIRPSSLPNTRFDFGVGPKNLNYTEINNGLAYRYFAYVVTSTGSSIQFWKWTMRSETWTFNITCQCSNHKKWTLTWLNELGGFDYYSFKTRNDKSRKIERTQYKRHLKSYNSGNGFKYQLGDRGRTIYNVDSKDSITLRSEFLNQENIDWLQWVYESPEVYLIDNESQKIYPVNCINDDITPYDKTNMGSMGTLYFYTITVEMANNRNVQRGGVLNTPTEATTGWWRDNILYQEYTKSLYE